MRLARNGRPFSLTRTGDRFFLVGADKLLVFPFFPERASRKRALATALRRIDEIAEQDDVRAALDLAEQLEDDDNDDPVSRCLGCDGPVYRDSHHRPWACSSECNEKVPRLLRSRFAR